MLMQSFCLVLATIFSLVNCQEYPEFVDFRVLSYAKFFCAAKGFRCGYHKEDFADYQMSSGSQDSFGEMGGQQNNIWSNVGSVDETLVLTDCQSDYCFVRCNYGCNCTLEDGNTTCADGTPPPQAAPPTDPPAICPEQINTHLCPQMITDAWAGSEYDCYNFCGGDQVSSCDFGGTCGAYSCANQGADGTTKGIIVGCTREMLNGNFDTNGGSAPSPSSSTSGATMVMVRTPCGFAVATAGAVVALLSLVLSSVA
jgi:hypothetical protein